ncbi:hypothetical protein D3C77_691380 [compost metagenome]
MIHVSVKIDGEGNANSTSDTAGLEQFATQIGTLIEQKYQQLRDKDLRQGGRLSNAIKGR